MLENLILEIVWFAYLSFSKKKKTNPAKLILAWN